MFDVPGLVDIQASAEAVVPMAGNLGIAFLCGLFLSWLYRRTYRGASYSMTFDRSLVTLTIITAIVIMVIGNNLARAFGLVGAMSIVRFRTAVKDAQDLVFIFFSLAVGLASGVGLHALALVGTLFVGAIIAAMARFNYGSLDQRELVVQLRYAIVGSEEPAGVYSPVLERFCKDFHLLGARSTETDRTLDMTFYVRLLAPGTAAALTAELTSLPQIASVSVFYDEEPL
jgi:uncharacterized membrane protein YhiD involved in acid resistance